MTVGRDAVIGAGIAGLALARALALRGREVIVFEADRRPQSASVRNFGTLWPIGQPAGPLRALALASVRIWRDVLAEAGAWSAPGGSLHVAYADDELQVMREFASAANADGFSCEMLAPDAALERSPRLRRDGLRGALFSQHELQVNPRQVLTQVSETLARQWNVRFEWATRITACGDGVVRAGEQAWPVERVWLAPGEDVQTLFPEQFAALGLRRCKLQMMRTAPVPWTLGPILAGGLTLRHYKSFASCGTLPQLQARLEAEWPWQIAAGVHVLVSQHEGGHLVIGDSHQYDEAITPFDQTEIDELILQYLRTFLEDGGERVLERWHGLYLTHPSKPFVIFRPQPEVTAIAALGGHGMTLSFGLAEQVVAAELGQPTSLALEEFHT